MIREISNELRSKHKIDEFFYPNISMNMQIPDGLEGEISDIARVLKESGLEVNTTNVLRLMELKKKLLIKYTSKAEREKVVTAYRELLATKIKPVGTALPLELILVDGVVVILLSVLGRFVMSFVDEAGKILARKVFDDDEKQSKKVNMTMEEYHFLKTEAKFWFDAEGNMLASLKKSTRVGKKHQPRIKKK